MRLYAIWKRGRSLTDKPADIEARLKTIKKTNRFTSWS